eukprot:1330754-Rhodomonas_salina.4
MRVLCDIRYRHSRVLCAVRYLLCRVQYLLCHDQYLHTRVLYHVRYRHSVWWVSVYAPPTRCPVLRSRMALPAILLRCPALSFLDFSLRAIYAVSGTEIHYGPTSWNHLGDEGTAHLVGAIGLGACYAMSGTDMAQCYLPTRLLCHARVPPLCSYALPTPCPHPPYRATRSLCDVLYWDRVCLYEIRGTEIGYAAMPAACTDLLVQRMLLHSYYALAGTVLGYAAMSSLCAVRY